MSDLAAAARILTRLAESLDLPDSRFGYYAATVRDLIRVLRPEDAAALLDAARRETQPEPRVWLPGDTVPAGTWVIDEDTEFGELWPALDLEQVFDRPVVEVLVPDFDAAVAAEQARRGTATGGTA